MLLQNVEKDAEMKKIDLSREIIIGIDEPIESENKVEFRLLYAGELPSSGNKSRPDIKHAIRREFHPQLRKNSVIQIIKVSISLHKIAPYR